MTAWKALWMLWCLKCIDIYLWSPDSSITMIGGRDNLQSLGILQWVCRCSAKAILYPWINACRILIGPKRFTLAWWNTITTSIDMYHMTDVLLTRQVMYFWFSSMMKDEMHHFVLHSQSHTTPIATVSTSCTKCIFNFQLGTTTVLSGILSGTDGMTPPCTGNIVRTI